MTEAIEALRAPGKTAGMVPVAPVLPKPAFTTWNFLEGVRECRSMADSFLLLVSHRTRRKFDAARKFQF